MPSSPFFIEKIGKGNFTQSKKTLSAIKKIEKELVKNEVESLIIITPSENEQISINLNTEYTTDFEKFGDFSIKEIFYPDHETFNEIRFAQEITSKPFLYNKSDVEYPVSVPAIMLSKNLKNLQLIPIECSQESISKHYDFGKQISKVIQDSSKKIAVLVSGNLSIYDKKTSGIIDHDKKIINILGKGNIGELLRENTQNTAFPRTVKPIAMLEGILFEKNKKFLFLAYEHPFNVGFLSAKYSLK